MSKNHPVLIIGAGIAGLSAAQVLAAVNIPSIVLDKGKGAGGRMATRRVGEAVFDHGTQYFSAKTPYFQKFVNNMVGHGIAKEWWPGIADSKHPRWVGNNGMNAVTKFLARDLTVLKGRKATKIMAVPNGWRVMTEDNETFEAAALIITIPAPQALELLENSGIHLPENPLKQIAYHPCLALLATLDRPSSIPPPGGLQANGAVVSWLADNLQKGISQVPSVTLHASPEFSRMHLDGDLQAAGSLMLEAVAGLIFPAHVLDWQVHRWRYSLAFERYPAPYFQAQTTAPLLFGGDGFGMGNVEGAYLSGLAMADIFIKQSVG